MQMDDQLERLREIAAEALQQRGLAPGSAPDLEKDTVAVGSGEFLVLLKLIDKTAGSPVKILLMRGTDNPLECLVVDSSDSKLIQTRILAMLAPFLEKGASEGR